MRIVTLQAVEGQEPQVKSKYAHWCWMGRAARLIAFVLMAVLLIGFALSRPALAGGAVLIGVIGLTTAQGIPYPWNVVFLLTEAVIFLAGAAALQRNVRLDAKGFRRSAARNRKLWAIERARSRQLNERIEASRR